jgi:hypothetical protein
VQRRGEMHLPALCNCCASSVVAAPPRSRLLRCCRSTACTSFFPPPSVNRTALDRIDTSINFFSTILGCSLMRRP